MDGKRGRPDGVDLLCAGTRSFSEVTAIGNPLIYYTSSHNRYKLPTPLPHRLPCTKHHPRQELRLQLTQSIPLLLFSSSPASPNSRDYDSRG